VVHDNYGSSLEKGGSVGNSRPSTSSSSLMLDTYLSIHEYVISIPELPSHDTTGRQLGRHGVAPSLVHFRQVNNIDTRVRRRKGQLDPASAGVIGRSPFHQTAHDAQIAFVDSFWKGQDLAKMNRQADFVGPNVQVGTNDTTTRVINTLAHHVLSKQAIFLFK
jgi:hypothetical protein